MELDPLDRVGLPHDFCVTVTEIQRVTVLDGGVALLLATGMTLEVRTHPRHHVRLG